MQDDNIITAKCSRASALNKANGNALGTRLDTPIQIWEDINNDSAIIASCFAVKFQGNVIRYRLLFIIHHQ